MCLESIPQTERPASAETCKYLLAGKLPWTAAKGLYDTGIMYRSASSDIIAPSRRGHLRAALSSIPKYYLRERGSAAVVYHRRPPSGRRGASSCSSIFWRLSWTPTQRWTPNCDGTKSREIRLQSSYALPFDAVDEVLPREAPVLYVPMSLTLGCDGIILIHARRERYGRCHHRRGVHAAQLTRAMRRAWIRRCAAWSPWVWPVLWLAAFLRCGASWHWCSTGTC